jgi:diguanylate cyclase (GGDEF)-like protein
LLADARSRGIAGVVAAVRGIPAATTDDCVLQPDVGDTASLALRSTACHKVLSELAGHEWWRATETEIGSITERAIDVAWLWEQMLRSAGHSGAWPEHLIKTAVDWTTLTLRDDFAFEQLGHDAAAVLKSLRDASSNRSIDQKLREIDGRNAVRVIAEAAARYTPLGIRPRQEVDAQTLVAMLNVAFDIETLEQDPVFWRMRRWQRRNRRFPLLKPWRVMDPFGLVWDQRYWRSDLEALLRLDPPEALAAFKMDLDNFKAVNEALGHAGGDEAIREYLRAVNVSLGAAAEVYRRGGDEVVAFAPGVSLSQAEILAEQLRAEVESRFRDWGAVRGLENHPTVSIGVVEATAGMTVERVEELMESAQWQAKHGGKNRVVSVPGE